MVNESKTMRRLGKRVAMEIGEGPDCADRLAQKEKILAAVDESFSGRRTRIIAASSVAAAVAFLVVSFVVFNSIPGEISFWVAGELEVSKPGRWVAATDTAVPIRFENGNNLELHPGTSLRIVESLDDEIKVAVDRGKVIARVAKQSTARMIIEIGPYRVEDIGTVFTVDWDPSTEVLNVSVEEGEVIITGDTLKSNEVRLTANEHYCSSDNKKLAVETQKEKPTAIKAELLPGIKNELGNEPEIKNTQTVADPVIEPSARLSRKPDYKGETKEHAIEIPIDADQPPKWQIYLAAGSHHKALEAAKVKGLEQIAQSAQSDMLWKLSQSARYSRDGASTNALLSAYSTRFGDTVRAQTALFLLGRNALEIENDPVISATWFESYLSEVPNGEFAQEALGRLISAYLKSGKNNKAKYAAQQYLKKHPDGLYKKLAKDTVQRF